MKKNFSIRLIQASLSIGQLYESTLGLRGGALLEGGIRLLLMYFSKFKLGYGFADKFFVDS